MEQRSEIVRFGLLEPSRSERKRRWLSRWVGLAAQVILIGLLASVGQLSQPARRFPLQGDYLVLQLPRATPEPRRQLTAKVKPSVSSARVEPRPEAPRPPPLEMPSAKTAAKVPPNPTLPEAPPRIPAPATIELHDSAYFKSYSDPHGLLGWIWDDHCQPLGSWPRLTDDTANLLVVFLLVRFYKRGRGKSREILPCPWPTHPRTAKKNGYSQEDMISCGFSARHWQQIEVGRPITVTTLLRICEVFRLPMARIVRGLDKGFYES
jgi:hypothetical protein